MATKKKKKRKSKHRGTAYGAVEARGRTGKSVSERNKAQGKAKGGKSRGSRAYEEPTLKSSFNKAAIASLFLFAMLLLIMRRSPSQAAGLSAIMLVLYVPLAYIVDKTIYRVKTQRQGQSGQSKKGK